MQNLELIVQIISVILISFSLVFTLGIIWRVEMKLDKAYKFFFGALLCLFLIKIMDVFIKGEIFSLIYQFLNLLFYILLSWGIWLVRDLIMDIDGER